MNAERKNKKSIFPPLNVAIIDMDDLKNPFWGAGQARATREVGKILAKRNKVTVYCTKYPGYKDYTKDGISYVHKGIVSSSPRFTNLMFVFAIPFFVARIKADVIVENFNAPFSISFSPIFTRVPVIGLPTMFEAEKFSAKYHLPFHWIERVGCKFYRYLMPYSKVCASKMKRLNHGIKMRIIPQGVGREYFSVPRRKAKHILFLGRFDIDQKGIDLLLKAYSLVKNKIDLPLVLAGHGPDEQKIRKLIRSLGLDNSVKIYGPAYGREKIKLMSETLFVAFPSRYEEMSLWGLEALAAGLPLIVFDLPEWNWVSDDICPKVRKFDVEEYSRSMLDLTNNPAKTIRIGKKAQTFVRSFTWEKVAGMFEDFFYEVIRAHKHNQSLTDSRSIRLPLRS